MVWDVGGGTGALALEIARLLPRGRVHTLERDPEAVELLQRNRQRFGIANLQIHQGQAPGDLHRLDPHPDRVLLEVGRPLGDVLLAVWEALAPAGRQVVQATVHRMQRRGDQTRLAAAEPLFLIAAERH
ncbi:MAG: methyltransferase domain-containing protein [Synechococcaceae bacterium WB6_3B_236]|nr:methyltransferase domain-containing protein [Synechococcaceae bacterium WB6_3B_236]